MRKPTYWICALADPSEIDLRLGAWYSAKRVRVAFDKNRLSVGLPPQKPDPANAHEMLTPIVTPVMPGDKITVSKGGLLKLRFDMDSPGDTAFELQDRKGATILRAIIKGRDQIVAHLLPSEERKKPSIPRVGTSETLVIRLKDENGKAMPGLPVHVSIPTSPNVLFYQDHIKQGVFRFACLTDSQGDLLPVRVLLKKGAPSKKLQILIHATMGNFVAAMVSVAIEEVADPKESTIPSLEASAVIPIQPLSPLRVISVTDLPTEEGLSPGMWDDTPKPDIRSRSVTPPPIVRSPHPAGVDFGSSPRPFDFSPAPKRTVPLGWMVAVVIFFAGIGIAGLGELLARQNGAHLLNGAHAAFEQTTTEPAVASTETKEIRWTIVHQRSLIADETPVASVCALRDPKNWCEAYQTDRRRSPERIVFTDCERLGEAFGCSCPASIDDTLAFLSYVPNQCVKVRLP